jgi:hypothetical protein
LSIEFSGNSALDDRDLLDWQAHDEKMRDKLRELIALPSFKGSFVSRVEQRLEEGGVRRQVRYELARKAGGTS